MQFEGQLGFGWISPSENQNLAQPRSNRFEQRSRLRRGMSRETQRGSSEIVTPDYWRQLDLITPGELKLPITVVGAGGIGSPTALALAKMGCSRLTVYDPDLVEPHNLPNQFYRLKDSARPKVEALRDLIRSFTGLEIVALQEAVSQQ